MDAEAPVSPMLRHLSQGRTLILANGKYLTWGKEKLKKENDNTSTSWAGEAAGTGKAMQVGCTGTVEEIFAPKNEYLFIEKSCCQGFFWLQGQRPGVSAGCWAWDPCSLEAAVGFGLTDPSGQPC